MTPTTDEGVENDRLQRLSDLIDDRTSVVEDFAPDSFGFHEALHTSSIVLSMFDDYVLSHPSIVRDPALYLEAHRAFEGLFNLYQTLANQHLNSDPTEEIH